MYTEATVADGDGVKQKRPPAISQDFWRAEMVGTNLPKKSPRGDRVGLCLMSIANLPAISKFRAG
jgi:hypothetical protein